MQRTISTVVLGVLIVGVLAIMPEVLSLYWLRLLTSILMLAVVAQGINVMAGYVGYPAFGNVVFFGLGAYGTAIAIERGVTVLPLALLCGVAPAVLVAAAVGPLLLRLRGHYFAIATLGLNEVMSVLAANLSFLTGGAAGLSLPLQAGTAAEIGRAAYFGFLALFAASLVLGIILRDSRFGLGCRAIRANEPVAEATGVQTLLVKSVAWIASAVVTAIAGGLYARWMGFIEPTLVFDMALSVKAFVMFLLGGAGTVFGPFIGAILIEGATTAAWTHLLKLHLMVLGVTIMLVVLVVPDGVQGLAARYWPGLRARWKRPVP